MFDTCMKRHVLIKDNTKTAGSHQQHIRIERMEKDNTLLDEHGLRRSDPSNGTWQNTVLNPDFSSFHICRSECKV